MIGLVGKAKLYLLGQYLYGCGRAVMSYADYRRELQFPENHRRYDYKTHAVVVISGLLVSVIGIVIMNGVIIVPLISILHSRYYTRR